MTKELSEAAKEARREYKRRWRAANRERVEETERQRWERLAVKYAEEKAEQEKIENKS